MQLLPLVLAAVSLQTVLAEFNPLQHSGPASPYFDAPIEDDVSYDTPDNCVVDQAAYIVRHGARYPEPGSANYWKTLAAKLKNGTYTVSGPLAFLASWTNPIDDTPHEPLYLSSTGALEAFSLGVQLRKLYKMTPGGSNFTLWSAGQQRVLDTATYFARGYLSQGNYITNTSANRANIIVLPDSVNYTFADSLTSSAGCPRYASGDRSGPATTAWRATWQNATIARLNKYIQGLTLDVNDIGGFGDLCGFLTEVDGDSSFCNTYTDSEWLKYEYAHDLNYYYGAGPGNPYSATVGYPWVKAMSDLFALGPGKTTPGGNITPPPLIMSFTHDNNLPPIMSALGLWNNSDHEGVYPLSFTKPSDRRQFRASHIVSFRGYVALERLSCTAHAPGKTVHHVANQTLTPQTKQYVRVRVNRAPVEIPACQSGPGRSCPLDQFTKYINKDRAAVAGDFIGTCGLSGVANATGVNSFFTVAPPNINNVLVGINNS
ncbi:unnamed protein product [Mycena citricolor]|uniref:Phosphoglycerate mutase-like protein n=1 Tax=Mycena citricolor TaxID=2018698 RepID=A0AAD2GVZ9_9AGAR|nr:unnamed protein product [Mycena citricolor]CAK5277306.1 unnamed protein product [Mycena citricolor]